VKRGGGLALGRIDGGAHPAEAADKALFPDERPVGLHIQNVKAAHALFSIEADNKVNLAFTTEH